MTRDQVNSSRSSMREFAETFLENVDAFNTQINETTRTLIDQPATVPANRERHRYYVDTGTGYTRVNNPIDDNTMSFEDNSNHYLIKCPAGERREFRTSERATYQSGYEAEWGIAWQAAEQLSNGQVIRIRLVDTPREDAIVAEYRKVNGEIEGEFYLQQASGKVNSNSPESFKPEKSLTDPRITKGFSNFYAVGEHRLQETFTESIDTRFNIRQDNTNKAIIGNLDDWSTESFNFHLGIEVDCTNSTSGLNVEAGTHNFKMRADTPETRRQKENRFINLQYDGTNDNYEPVLAARVNPAKDNIPLELDSTELIQPAGTAGELVVVGVFPDEVGFVDETAWTRSPQQSMNNSVVEVNETVDQIVQPDGTLGVDVGSVNNNMRQISVSSTASRKATGSSPTSTIKAPVHPDEVAVYLVKTDDGSAAQFNIRSVFEENW